MVLLGYHKVHTLDSVLIEAMVSKGNFADEGARDDVKAVEVRLNISSEASTIHLWRASDSRRTSAFQFRPSTNTFGLILRNFTLGIDPLEGLRNRRIPTGLLGDLID